MYYMCVTMECKISVDTQDKLYSIIIINQSNQPLLAGDQQYLMKYVVCSTGAFVRCAGQVFLAKADFYSSNKYGLHNETFFTC